MTRQFRGLYFQDIQEGAEFESPARTVTETDIVNFAGLSGDYNALHTDAEYGKTTPFGERIAHGLLGLAITSGLMTQLGSFDGTILAFLSLEWKFKAPVKIGDTLHVQAQVLKRKPMPAAGGGVVVLGLRVLNQRGETTQLGEWTVLVKSRPDPAPAG